MPFTEKEIEQIIKEIKERVEKQVGLISEGAMEYLAEGLREKLAEMQTEITEMEKERLITVRWIRFSWTRYWEIISDPGGPEYGKG